jgi:glutaredoxin-like protein NrdH
MEIKRVKGKKKGEIFLYTLSTCGWCRKTKQLLNEKGVEYAYVDVDLLEDDENEEALKDMQKWNPNGSFPTIIINGKSAIKGYDPKKLLEVIEE